MDKAVNPDNWQASPVWQKSPPLAESHRFKSRDTLREVLFSVVPLVVSQTEQQSISLTYLLLRITADLINAPLIISEVQDGHCIVFNDTNDAVMVWGCFMSFKYLMNREGKNHNSTILLDFNIWGNIIIYCLFQSM